jgi:hypothetical protein
MATDNGRSTVHDSDKEKAYATCSCWLTITKVPQLIRLKSRSWYGLLLVGYGTLIFALTVRYIMR